MKTPLDGGAIEDESVGVFEILERHGVLGLYGISWAESFEIGEDRTGIFQRHGAVISLHGRWLRGLNRVGNQPSLVEERGISLKKSGWNERKHENIKKIYDQKFVDKRI